MKNQEKAFNNSIRYITSLLPHPFWNFLIGKKKDEASETLNKLNSIENHHPNDPDTQNQSNAPSFSTKLTEKASFWISHYQSHFPMKRNQFPFSSLKAFHMDRYLQRRQNCTSISEASGLEMGMGSMGMGRWVWVDGLDESLA
ncbi:hypothetical protein CEXT_381111 [Caerostris extrusa]|uniref:Uncharacterized protein n=1 Tax=Caerostris extrusa TaxID=172846 RepID=A0AAV4SLK1_CAEEX|nr:hypothetical protein CEXT_381111 [Caerostris extrusa]